MATTQQPAGRNRRSNTGWIVFLLLLALLLAGGNAYLYYLFSNKEQEALAWKTRVDTLEALNQRLEALKQRLQREVDSLAQVNLALAQEKQAILDSVERLQKKLARYRRAVAYWRKQAQSAQPTGTTMPKDVVPRRQYDSLLAEYNRLRAEVRNLEALVAEKDNQISALQNELEEVRKELARKILASDITVTGFRKKKDQDVPTDKARKIERLKICFKLEQNPHIQEESLDILFRIIAPTGETLQMQSMGSGTFTGTDGRQYPYTFKSSVVYPPAGPKTCLYWEPFLELTRGQHKIFLYYNGALIGSSTFYLR